MIVCSHPECQTTAGCKCASYQPFYISPRQSLPVQMPVPIIGMVTIAIMENDGSVTIKVDQPAPNPR